jgi:anti-sigma-K factor RskA
VVVLNANPEAAQALNASFVASVTADGRALVLRPINDLALSPGRALELWAVPAQGAPRSLGLVQASGATTVLRTQLLRDTAAFAVSVEPVGGSTTGAPTGPIVSVGKVQI